MAEKLTDKEIIKALECCNIGEDWQVCDKCPCYVENETAVDCVERLHKNTLDLINRQQAEIERLNKEVDRLSQVVLCNTNVDEIKSEAIKEFAERLKGKQGTVFPFGSIVSIEDIDNLVKEMVGEDK